uniref:ER membrane protein complex subunit 3-like n=1 Tax=Rhizophora mucronata TaxID=61149 RepID=A0A2P2LZA3_RHIMU
MHKKENPRENSKERKNLVVEINPSRTKRLWRYKIGSGAQIPSPNNQLPFFDDLGIGNLGGAHELGDEVAKDSDEHHHNRQWDQHPVSNRRI